MISDRTLALHNICFNYEPAVTYMPTNVQYFGHILRSSDAVAWHVGVQQTIRSTGNANMLSAQ